METTNEYTERNIHSATKRQADQKRQTIQQNMVFVFLSRVSKLVEFDSQNGQESQCLQSLLEELSLAADVGEKDEELMRVPSRFP